jgi:hypothetical protein
MLLSLLQFLLQFLLRSDDMLLLTDGASSPRADLAAAAADGAGHDQRSY